MRKTRFIRFILVALLTVALFSFAIPSKNAYAQGEPTDPPTTETTDTTSDSCETEGGEFAFFLCPALRGANEGIEILDGRIRTMLEVNPDYLRDEADGREGGVESAWARIRNVAYILLIPIMLLMVIGTALQFSFVDAYTVKRALPRMIVAVIFIAISFDFARIMIEATNAIGRGVGGLIAQPFGGADNLELTDIFEPGAGEFGFLATSGFIAGVSLAVVGAVSTGILASYLLVSVVVLIIVFFILTLRELLLVFLAIMSPIAILSWIFPGNDKLWKLWWGTFSKLLMLYPLIISILMVGRGFASIINSTTGASDSGSWITTLIKITAYIGPFFFIPKAFQYAGGVFANVAGMVNDRGRGFFDRQKKWRGDKREKRREQIASGGFFRPSGRLGRSRFGGAINGLGSDAYNLKDAVGRDGLRRGATMTGIRNSRDRRRIHEEAAAAKDEALGRKGMNDNFLAMLRGVMNGENDEQLISYLEGNGYNRDEARVAVAQGKNMYDQYGHGLGKIISDGMAASKTSHTANVSEFMAQIVALSHGSESAGMEMLGSGRGAFAQAGRLDIALGSYGEQAAMLNAMFNINRNGGNYTGPSVVRYFDEVTGQHEEIDFSGVQAGTETIEDLINRRQSQKARDSFGTWDWSKVHPTSVRRLTTDLTSGIDSTQTQLRRNDITPEQRRGYLRTLGQQVAQLQNLRQNAMQSGNDEIQRIVADAFDRDTPIDLGMDGVQFNSITQLIEDTQGRASGLGVTRNNGQYAPADTLAQIDPVILEGYRSVSKTGNMSSEEQMERLRRANEN